MTMDGYTGSGSPTAEFLDRTGSGVGLISNTKGTSRLSSAHDPQLSVIPPPPGAGASDEKSSPKVQNVRVDSSATTSTPDAYA